MKQCGIDSSEESDVVSWDDLFLELRKLQDRAGNSELMHSVDPSVGFAVGVVTFRIGADGVARMIAARTRAIRDEVKGSRIVLITGSVQFWDPSDLCDHLVIEPLLGLDSAACETATSWTEAESSMYRDLPSRIWDEGIVISQAIAAAAKQHDLDFLVVDNVNSLPYNISASLGCVLASEALRIPVVNVCHDFFWEHFEGTRAGFAAILDLPETAGLVHVLCPWRSPLWLQATTTETAKKWLISRGWADHEVVVIPYGMTPVSDDDQRGEVFRAHLEEIAPQTGVSPDDIQSANPIRIRSNGSSSQGAQCQKKRRWIVTVPTKISSGKRLDRAIELFHFLLRQQAIRDSLGVEEISPTLVIAGPPYDVSEESSYLRAVVNRIHALLSDAEGLAWCDHGNRGSVEVVFLKGVPPPESTVAGLNMRHVFSATDIIVSCSRRETWGLPILDAAHFGRPIIAMEYVGAHRDVFEEICKDLYVLRLPEVGREALVDSETVGALACPLLLGAMCEYNRSYARQHLCEGSIWNAMKVAVRTLSERASTASQYKSGLPASAKSADECIGQVGELASLLLTKAEASTSQPLIVAIGGAPGSGKTTLAEALVAEINRMTDSPDAADTLSLDDFGMTLEEMQQAGLRSSPESIRVKHLLSCISRIQEGLAVPVPRFVHGRPIRGWRLARASRLLLLEGVFAFVEDRYGADSGKYRDLQGLIDLRLFLKTDVHRRVKSLVLQDLHRRMTIDRVIERLRERESQIWSFVIPFEDQADLVVTMGEGEQSGAPGEMADL